MKTFDQILVEQPTLYDGIAGYAWSTSENKWVNTGVSEVCKAQIEDWFGLREVCDDTKFARFFARKMNLVALRYAQQLRIELSSFDPLVSEYIERENLSNNSKQSAGSIDKNISGSKQTSDNRTAIRTPDLTEVIDRDTSGSHSSEEGGSDEINRSGSKDSETVQVQKNAPMSVEYAGAVAGEIPKLSWGSLTQQQQSKASESNSSDETTNYGKTTQGSDSGSEDVTKRESGTDTNVVTGSQKVGSASSEGIESSQAESASGKQHEVYTGRHGLTPQAAFKSAVSYIKGVSSFDWLKNELEDCFMAIYDI